MAGSATTTASRAADGREAILARYRERTPGSKAHHANARELLPGGINRNIVYHAPHPLVIRSGNGAYLTDVDGNRYLDMIGNYTSMILGHCPPGVVEAAEEQLCRGTAWAAVSEAEATLAGMIVERLPSAEQVRFTASGTEATMMAMRAARAHTGRPLIAKFEGGYHGIHDYATVSLFPPLDVAGPAERPTALAPPGIPDEVRDTVLVLPFNAPDAVAAIIEAHAERLAGVILEPIIGAGGIIPPADGFLPFLREITERHGIVLIFDEVISFRVAYGGAQEHYGVTPDLTALGKIIGGGFPTGAVAGLREIMAVFDPSAGPAPVTLSGTFHANPVMLAAGIATLEQLTRDAIEDLNRFARRVGDRLRQALATAPVPMRLNQVGSLLNIHVTDEPVVDYRSSARADLATMALLQMALLNEGVFLAPRGMACLSVPMTDADANLLLDAVGAGLEAITPALQ